MSGRGIGMRDNFCKNNTNFRLVYYLVGVVDEYRVYAYRG